MDRNHDENIVLFSILFGVMAGAFVGLNILAMIKGFSGGLIEVLRELSLRFH